MQSSIRYSRKLAALGRLLAGVAHEVKNPLNAMTIHLELLKRKLGVVEPSIVGAGGRGGALAVPERASVRDPADVMKHLTVIGGEIRRLDQVMQDFLKFARPEELKPEAIDVGALIDELVPLIEPEASKTGVRVETVRAAGLPAISGDPGMLKQAFLNLALNACQAMPAGGVLRIACSEAAGGRVRVDVQDTGTGIQPEHLERIFDLYFTTKEKGSGVGLSLVYRIVQLHDGEVEVESTPGRGTTFRVFLPQSPH
jgi:signal transduction histidine kinase